MHLFFRDWYEKGGRMRKHHGEISGRKEKYNKRDELICKIFQKKKSEGIDKLLIYHIINGELRRRKYLPKGKEISDERLRKIISKRK
jgi:hypothetical protein